jgi:hypothetical protein
MLNFSTAGITIVKGEKSKNCAHCGENCGKHFAVVEKNVEVVGLSHGAWARNSVSKKPGAR